jgi:DNA-binding NtrC family response regulator
MTDETKANGAKVPHILVVDDEPAVRHVLRIYLEREGCDVTTAGSAEEALRLLPEANPDVALVDIVLPGKSGVHLLGQIKRQYPQVEVVLITSHGSVETTIDAIHRGACDYLQKPFERLEDVWLTVQRALEKRNVALQMRDMIHDQAVRSREITRTAGQLVEPEDGADSEDGAHESSGAKTPEPVGESES